MALSVSAPVTSPTSGEVSLQMSFSVSLLGVPTVTVAASVLSAPVTFAATMGWASAPFQVSFTVLLASLSSMLLKSVLLTVRVLSPRLSAPLKG